ncbi:unnamed protein product [Blepharisma stoltei]|uniref:Nucleotide exchange factor SIL1 n=1 Tax=Blepharisma stoltei TaxID=1481888 RepID=A0AAU9I8K6_9CILI|nr:unnamed protein product [Blepharisma stoltei]
MGCCSGRLQKHMNEPSLMMIKEGQEIVDKTYFSNASSNYMSIRSNHYSKQFNVASIESKHLNQELEELSLALSNMNLEKIEEVFESSTRITIDAIFHSWAENPKTIGELAIHQFGIFVTEKGLAHEPLFIESIKKTEIVDKLLEYAKSQERDKYEAAVLALCSLLENQAFSEILIKKNALAIFIKHLNDEKEWLRGTAALCCRNLYVARPRMQQEFIDGKGSEQLLKLLRSENSITVFETILNLLDLILDDKDRIQINIKEKLQDLCIIDELDRIIMETSIYDQDTINEAAKFKILFN